MKVRLNTFLWSVNRVTGLEREEGKEEEEERKKEEEEASCSSETRGEERPPC